MSTQIPTTIPMNPITSTSTTTTTTRPLTKGISINEGAGGSSSIPNKSTLGVGPKDKGKSIPIVQSEEEKKKQQAIEIKNKGR